jgi:hypothetical protein
LYLIHINSTYMYSIHSTNVSDPLLLWYHYIGKFVHQTPSSVHAGTPCIGLVYRKQHFIKRHMKTWTLVALNWIPHIAEPPICRKFRHTKYFAPN